MKRNASALRYIFMRYTPIMQVFYKMLIVFSNKLKKKK
jgi:hypothetical protein